MRPPPECFYEKGTLREHSGPQPVTAQGKRLQLLQGEQTEKPNSWERRYGLSCSANKPSNKNTTTDKYLTIIKYLLCQAMLTLQDFFSSYLIIIWIPALLLQYVKPRWINNCCNRWREVSYCEYCGTPVYAAL